MLLLKKQNARRLKQIEARIEAIDAELEHHVKADARLQSRFESLVGIPGIGSVTALALLIEMPELGMLDNSAAASLAGLAPITRESGRWKGKSLIAGYDVMIKAGKPAITAILRKLVVLANALLENRSTRVEKTT